jgi:hypothetical protein
MPWDAILIAGKAVLWWGLPLAFAVHQLLSVRRLWRTAQDEEAVAQSPRSSAEASRRERAAPASRRARS